MECLIIEDEPLIAEHLIYLIQKIEPTAKVVAVLPSVSQSVKWLIEHEVDLIFLDIHLQDGNSFQIFKQLPVQTPVIFCTAYDEFAIKAFQVNSLAYLLKPIDEHELKSALLKYKNLYQGKPKQDTKNALFQHKFLIQSGSHLIVLPYTEISFVHTFNKTVIINTFKEHQHSFDITLDQMEKRLDPTLFFRINRQYIMNKNAIQFMKHESRGRVRIESIPQAKDELIVSVDRSAAFKNWIKE
jgi:two-component system, LytTR family, response regulator LytT